jgi:hypothetical protein
MPPDAKVVKVGACEFPFYVHDHCKDRMSEVAGFVTELCSLADEQPEGLLWLGSWDASIHAGASGGAEESHGKA